MASLAPMVMHSLVHPISNGDRHWKLTLGAIEMALRAPLKDDMTVRITNKSQLCQWQIMAPLVSLDKIVTHWRQWNQWRQW
jgi:hypothetical protein